MEMRYDFGAWSLGKPKIGLVLGSGSARGWAHIGVIQALVEAKLIPDLLCGCSAGAVVSAFYCANALDRLIEYAEIHRKKLNTLAYADLSLSGGGLLKGVRFGQLLYDYLPVRDFSELSIPLGIVTTDITSMLEVHITKGKIIPAIRASTAVPFAFKPMPFQNRQFLDGGIVNPVPVHLARKMGADFTIAVDLDNTEPQLQAKTPLAAFYRSLWTMTNRIAMTNSKIFPADVVIKPDINDIGYTDYHRNQEAIQIGYATTKRMIGIIKDKLEKPLFNHSRHHIEKAPHWINSFVSSAAFSYDPLEKDEDQEESSMFSFINDLPKLSPQFMHNVFNFQFTKTKHLARDYKRKLVYSYKLLRKRMKHSVH